MFRGASGAVTGGRTNAKGRIKQIPGNCVPNTERRQNSTADIRLLKPACLLRASHCSGALTSAVTPGIPKTAGSSAKLTERTCKTQDLYSLVTFAQTERASDLAQKQEGDSLSAAAGEKNPKSMYWKCLASASLGNGFLSKQDTEQHCRISAMRLERVPARVCLTSLDELKKGGQSHDVLQARESQTWRKTKKVPVLLILFVYWLPREKCGRVWNGGKKKQKI